MVLQFFRDHPAMHRFRVLAGAVVWLAATGFCWWWLSGRGDDSALPSETSRVLQDYLAGQRRQVPLRPDVTCDLSTGDAIFWIDDSGRIIQVGEVAPAGDLVSPSVSTVGAKQVKAVFYASSPPIDGDTRLSFHRSPGSMEWVLKTMLPAEKRKLIADQLRAAFQQHHDDILTALRPVIDESLRDAYAVVEQDLPKAISRHREEFERIGGRYQAEVVEKEIVPLVREEVWPIVREHAEPAVESVGQEIWQRVSLWRFGWRYVYDRSSLPQKDLTRKEWERFVEQDAMPILEDHTDDFIAAQRKIMTDVVSNPKIQSTMRKHFGQLVNDPEVRGIVWRIIREAITDNPRMHAVIDKHWRSPQMREALSIASERLEPTAVHIGELLLGSPEDGITPEFARVLRNQVLAKDRRWLLLHPGNSQTGNRSPAYLKVVRGSDETVNPFVRS